MWIRRLKQALHSDFAFRQDTTLAALPLVIAFLTLLSICMTHSAAYIKQVTISGSEALSQRLHLHLPYGTGEVARRQVRDELGRIDGVARFQELDAAQVKRFLQNWLGTAEGISDDFPVPVILDIILHPDANRSTVQASIREAVAPVVKNMLLESYDESIAAFNESSRMVKNGIYILGLVVIATTALIVIVASRINLGVHRRHIEVLHHLGAADGYINRQFVKRVVLIALQGVALGTLLSVALLEVLQSQMDVAFLREMASHSPMWAYYLLNPALLLVLVTAAAWVSIEAQLRQMH